MCCGPDSSTATAAMSSAGSWRFMSFSARPRPANCGAVRKPVGRLIFINRFYWPDEPATAQLLADLAEALSAAGRDVTVIASNPDAARVPHRENYRGVQ